MDSYIFLHSVCLCGCVYFMGYSLQRIFRHWSDGKERVRTSGKRLLAKIILTVVLGIFQFVHIADFVQGEYNKSRFIARTMFFSFSGVSWLFSSFLVYFDYSRRLKSEWRGQKSFWVFGFLTNIALLILNFILGLYKFQGSKLFQFDIIQIVTYSISILICGLLSYYAIFRPNDFSMISKDLYLKMKRPSLLFEDTHNESFENQIQLTVKVTGYKIKQLHNTSLLYFNISVSVNEANYTISRSLADFESLDLTLREKFPITDFPNLRFPDLNIQELRKSTAEDRGTTISKYLANICCADFMTPDLLNFLQIEGDYRDLLSYRHNQLIEESLFTNEPAKRTESSIVGYYTPVVARADSISTETSNWQWIVLITIPNYRYEETTHALDFFLKAEIPLLEYSRMKPYDFKAFCHFHKFIKKLISPAVPAEFPSKNYSKSFKKRDKEAIDFSRIELENYFRQIFNDPAYLCKEALDLIGCDADLSQLLCLIPSAIYRISEESSWEWDISEDSTHYIIYSINIGKICNTSNFEHEWKIKKRYREFDTLNKILQQRHSSPLLKSYLVSSGKISKDCQVPPLPNLPSKTISPLSTSAEIEDRKYQLEKYMSQLFVNPAVLCSFQFREFIQDKS